MWISYLKFKKGWLQDTYIYADSKKFKMDDYLIGERISVDFVGDMSHPEHPDFVLSILKCWKWDSALLEDKIFPRLDNALTIKYGKSYMEFIDFAQNTFTELVNRKEKHDSHRIFRNL